MSHPVFAHIREGLRLRRPISARALGNSQVRFVRLGDELYLGSPDLHELGDFVNDDDIIDFEDVVYENNVNSDSVIEEVELNDLAEINTSETAPLLETGAGAAVASGTSAGAANTAAIVTGVSIGAGIITVGTTAGILSNRDDSSHKKPTVSVDPEHNYIGPGNEINESVAPIDVDDEIAKEHDIAYEKAQTDDDIHEADRVGANEFLTDALETGNPHSIAGYIGLKGKEILERNTGVIYGSPSAGKPWVDIGGNGILIIGLISVLIFSKCLEVKNAIPLISIINKELNKVSILSLIHLIELKMRLVLLLLIMMMEVKQSLLKLLVVLQSYQLVVNRLLIIEICLLQYVVKVQLLMP